MTEQPALFPGLEAPEPKHLRRHAEMLWLYGACPGHHCGECAHLTSDAYHRRRYLKCKIAGVTASAATDWCAKWDACGKFEANE